MIYLVDAPFLLFFSAPRHAKIKLNFACANIWLSFPGFQSAEFKNAFIFSEYFLALTEYDRVLALSFSLWSLFARITIYQRKTRMPQLVNSSSGSFVILSFCHAQTIFIEKGYYGRVS